jgi:hypothetical protein
MIESYFGSKEFAVNSLSTFIKFIKKLGWYNHPEGASYLPIAVFSSLGLQVPFIREELKDFDLINFLESEEAKEAYEMWCKKSSLQRAQTLAWLCNQELD